MYLCFKLYDSLHHGGVQHCYQVPVYEVPVKIGPIGPGPINYPPIFFDASMVATIGEITNKITDTNVREAVQAGLREGVKAMQKRAGDSVSIRMEDAAQSVGR
jgi:hypothetical protein